VFPALALALLAAAAAALLLPDRAQSTAGILSSSPPIAAEMTPEEAPTEVTVWFTEPIETDPSKYALKVKRDISGVSIVTGPVLPGPPGGGCPEEAAEGEAGEPCVPAYTSLTVPIEHGLGEAAYRVEWRTTSAVDGSIAAASFRWCIGERLFTICSAGHVHAPGPQRGSPTPARSLEDIPTATATTTPTATNTPEATETVPHSPTVEASPTASPTAVATLTPTMTASAAAPDPTATPRSGVLGESRPRAQRITLPDTGEGATPESPTRHGTRIVVAIVAGLAIGTAGLRARGRSR
jgi:methionine-rich copper-binding protein CopC